MPRVDTAFFLSLMKGDEWHESSADEFHEKTRSKIWTSPAILAELLILAKEYKLDPERMLLDVLELVELRGAAPFPFLNVARFMRDEDMGMVEALQSATAVEPKEDPPS